MTSPTYRLLASAILAASVVLLATGCSENGADVVADADSAAAAVGNDIDDTVVTTQVKSALLGDEAVKSFYIQVETRKGVVQLSGFVDSQAHIDHAVSVAESVQGVNGTVSRMTVRDAKVSAVEGAQGAVDETRIKQ